MTKYLLVAAAAAAFSTQAMAQAPETGGWAQRDQTRAEAQQRADAMFQRLDANHDGNVTKAEADQALARFEAARGGEGGRGGGRAQRMIEQAFATSQSITLAQFEAQALARFDAQDLNHDGVVSAAEREQAREARRAQGGN